MKKHQKVNVSELLSIKRASTEAENLSISLSAFLKLKRLSERRLKRLDKPHVDPKNHDHAHSLRRRAQSLRKLITEQEESEGYGYIEDADILTDNVQYSNDIPWGYLSASHSHNNDDSHGHGHNHNHLDNQNSDHEDTHEHASEILESAMLFVNNTGYEPKQVEEGRKIYFQIKNTILHLDEDSSINIQIACDFSDINPNPAFPKEHHLKDDLNPCEGWILK